MLYCDCWLSQTKQPWVPGMEYWVEERIKVQKTKACWAHGSKPLWWEIPLSFHGTFVVSTSLFYSFNQVIFKPPLKGSMQNIRVWCLVLGHLHSVLEAADDVRFSTARAALFLTHWRCIASYDAITYCTLGDVAHHMTWPFWITLCEKSWGVVQRMKTRKASLHVFAICVYPPFDSGGEQKCGCFEVRGGDAEALIQNGYQWRRIISSSSIKRPTSFCWWYCGRWSNAAYFRWSM